MQNNYHYLKIDEVLRSLNTSSGGLSKKEAKKRLKEYGPNRLPRKKVLSRFSIFLSQFKSPLVYILLVAGIISGVLGEMVDMTIIFTAIAVNVIIGFIQEDKANRALAHLKKMVERKAIVLREGKEYEINADDLVPGDVVVLSEGDRIPADGRLINARDLEINEASLTGESLPIQKNTNPIDKETVLAERKNMVYMGTLVTRGRAYFIVTATGIKSHFGEIASLVRETEEEATPLQARISHFSHILGAIIVVATVGLFVSGILLGRSALEMFLTSVAVAVASIPEGLPISITVILAIGMQKMSKRKALTRKMVAAETLGSVSVICTDKTGTLTLGEMRMANLFTFYGDLLDVSQKKLNEIQNGTLETAMKISLLCNNAVVTNPQDKLKNWLVHGDSTERALLFKGYELGFDKEKLEKEMPRLDEIPFNSDRKFMATLHKRTQKENLVLVKGAPEIIFKKCSKIIKHKQEVELDSEFRAKFKAQLEDLTSKGLRVLALAYKKTPTNGKLEESGIKDLVFVGLVGLKDPLRETSKATIELAKKAGIRPVVVTGDHILTAKAIGKEIGLRIDKENVLEGKDIDELTDAELKDRVGEIDIFARVLPKHKLRIVDAWQKRGEIVAMTGDGVNDAPAIKSADIGIALGSGSDVTKETSDVVLMDDNFQTIVEAVRRGRIIFDNIRKVITYLLSDSFTEVFLVAGALLMGLPLPVTAAQILWVNLVEDSFPNLALAFDRGERDVMDQKPRRRKTPILNNEIKAIIIIVGLLTNLFLLGVFYFIWKITKNLEYARTITFIGLGIDSLFIVYACRSLRRSLWHMYFWKNHLLNLSVFVGIVMLLAVVYVPFFQDVLRTVPLGLREWGLLIGIGMLNLILIEFVKWIFIHKRRLGKI
ncbi:cation-translocating P-type ATPase [Patescibacteria group bacterium]